MTKKTWTDAEVAKLWPQARQELLSFAMHLEHSGAGITAKQITMAVQLADQADLPDVEAAPDCHCPHCREPVL